MNTNQIRDKYYDEKRRKDDSINDELYNLFCSINSCLLSINWVYRMAVVANSGREALLHLRKYVLLNPCVVYCIYILNRTAAAAAG